MANMLGYDTENPLFYVTASVVVWVTVWSLASVIRGGAVTEGIVPGLFGGLAFGIASLYLQRVTED